MAQSSEDMQQWVDAHEALIEERGKEYGDTITPTDRWIKEHLKELGEATSPFTMIMMFNKLQRALTSPNKVDHYDDIIGYSKLALKRIQAEAIVSASGNLDALEAARLEVNRQLEPTASHWLYDR